MFIVADLVSLMQHGKDCTFVNNGATYNKSVGGFHLAPDVIKPLMLNTTQQLLAF